jgi:pseudouridine-5'-phosphate glycosidase/pseudouridine kinase
MDVSADLIELGRTPMGVICAGAKSILDIPRTLEVLETQGVCVAAYGQKEFPAFYTPSSGAHVCHSLDLKRGERLRGADEKAPWRVDDPISAARLIREPPLVMTLRSES